tara:strand:- start:1072 stop:1383 length:312 start_codon:yes stop_codon:yes gene_type:complete
MLNSEMPNSDQIKQLIKSAKELSSAYEKKQEVFMEVILEADNLISGLWTMTETVHEQTKDDMIHSLETISNRVNRFQNRNDGVIQLLKKQMQEAKDRELNNNG